MPRRNWATVITRYDLEWAAKYRPTWDFSLFWHSEEQFINIAEIVRGESAKLDAADLVQTGKFAQTITKSIGMHSGFASCDGSLTAAEKQGTEHLGVFGPYWEGHALNFKSGDYGNRFTEPKATQDLSYFLSPQEDEPDAEARCIQFVKALFHAAMGSKPPGMDFTILPSSLVVANERPVRIRAAKGRAVRFIDLRIEWTSTSGKRIVIIIEAKFKHKGSASQLRIYRNAIRRKEADVAYLYFFYLTKDARTEPGIRSVHWHPVSWFGLLRHWESGLATENISHGPDGFSSFRRALWDNCYKREEQ